MILAGTTTREVEEYLEYRDIVLIPVGSMEQHGEAAPLACDTIIPVKLCESAGIRTGTAVTPAITFGMSENHMCFPGTITLRCSTLAAVAEDIIRSLYYHGFRKMVFLSGHGGNRSSILSGMAKASEECADAELRYLLYRDLPGAVKKQQELFCPDPGYHITVTEVSMVWHLMGAKMPDFDKRKFPPEPPVGSVISRERWREMYPDGGAGSDLKYVSEEKGMEFFEFLVNGLCSYLDQIEQGDSA